MIDLFDPAILASALRAMTPIALAALGGLLCARVGVFNVALEGLILTGAFCGVAGTYLSGSVWIGLIVGMSGAVLVSLLLAVGAVVYGGNEVVLGISLNLLAAGLTVFAMQLMFEQRGVFQPSGLEGLPLVRFPAITEIPVLGGLFASQSVVVYGMFVLYAAAQYFLFRQKAGLRLRGVGEHPTAAASLGVSVARYRITAILVSGALCGLAGVQLALGDVRLFAENMSGGRGWIAVVAVIFGRNHPVGVLAACSLFGFVDAVGIRSQGEGLPPQLTGAAPYLVTIMVLVLIYARRGRRSGTEGMA